MNLKSRTRTLRQPTGPEIIDPTALRLTVEWQPENMEGRVVFEAADRVLQADADGNERLVRIEDPRRYAMRHSALRARRFTRPDGSTITGAQIEADLQLVLDALAAAGDAAERQAAELQAQQAAESQRLQAEAERIQREAEAHNKQAEAARERMEAEHSALELQLVGEPRRA